MSGLYLCITPFFPSPKNWRGSYVLDQVKAIERNSNFKVIVFTPCGLIDKPSSYTVEGLTVNRVRSFFMPSYFLNGFGGGVNGKMLIKELKRLNISIADIKIAHCHTAAFACFATALKRANPEIFTIMQYHDLDPYQIRHGKFANIKFNAQYRANKFIKQFKYIDLHLCISKRVKFNLEHFPNSHPDEQFQPYLNALKPVRNIATPQNIRSYVLYNGVDPEVFHKISVERNCCNFKIGCIANFVDLKGHITLIKAIETIVGKNPKYNITVSFIGSGPTKESCIKYINSHNLQKYFSFEDEVRHEKLPEYYNSLDLFVLPSCFEGFGCVYTEAAACGVPFIGCYNQGYSEYINDEDKHMWLITPNDYRMLAQLIERQITNPIKQNLQFSYNINELISNFLNYLKRMKDV